MNKPKPSKERFCPSCGEGKVDEVKGIEPYSEDYLMCNKCDSTFNKEHMKEMRKSRVDIQKKHMRLYELQYHVDKLIEQGYSDTPVYFDTEAKTYDCHIVPIGSINLVPKEAMGEDYIILYEYQYTEKPEEPIHEDKVNKIRMTEEGARELLESVVIDGTVNHYTGLLPSQINETIKAFEINGYIIPVKSEEPLIIHNVLNYKGKNYLKQPYTACGDCAFNESKEDCSIQNNGNITIPCEKNIWKSFDDIQITDELACMRKDIGDIYLIITDNDTPIIDKFYGITAYNAVLVSSKDTYKEYVRLATAEEIQKYLEMNKKCK